MKSFLFDIGFENGLGDGKKLVWIFDKCFEKVRVLLFRESEFWLTVYTFFLFERMENENSPKANDMIVEKMKSGDYTIEHIMPQPLTPEWKCDLGDVWENICATYLHTFANLILTGFNVSYSNHSFADKKKGMLTVREIK